MKKDNWLVYGIILLTSSTTVLTMSDGTFFGLLRGLGAAGVLDGLILFWESRSEKLVDATQRKFAVNMKWAGVGMLVTIAIAFVFTGLVPVDAEETIDIFGLVFASTIRDLIHWVIVGVISLWVVLTLGVVMRIREIDPETKKDISLSEAHEMQENEEIDTYKSSMRAIGQLRGTEKAIKRLRQNLKDDGCTPVEIEALVNKAMLLIMQERGEIIPVNMPAPAMNTYQAAAPSVDANFTKPSTATKNK